MRLHFSILLLGLGFWLGAQSTIDTTKLRRGAFFTIEEAKAEQASMAKNLNSKSDWVHRASMIKNGILVGAEIKNFPKNKPVNAVVHSLRVMEGYTIEKVFFESVEGIYVSGNLYKPAKLEGKLPAVLAPHGHGKDPRFAESTQMRCAVMAMMGSIVFAYDMIGMGDMLQCDHRISHALKLQTINGIRALDFVSQLPHVDTKRIAITGASGGGTQSFVLTAIDDRITLSMPVVMVSGYFFGGCPCESGMPIHQGHDHSTTNVEIASCAAPRPMLLVSDGDDWTKYTPEFEFPFIKRVYDWYGAGSEVENVHLKDEKHDYGPSKRKAAYAFLGKHFNLEISLADEAKVQILTKEDLSVFDLEHPRPSNAIMGNDAIIKSLSKYK